MIDNKGLNDAEVKEARNKYGNNSITGKRKDTFFSLFIETLGDPIIKILLIALAIKTIFLFRDFDYFETIGIVIAILVASLISAISEYGSNKAFERMQEESSKINVKVLRNGTIKSIPIDDIVKGDILVLSSGDKVGADALLIKGSLSVDESSINGETKEAKKVACSSNIIYNEKNKVYRGTTIYEGSAYAKVLEVGMNTLYGKMASALTEESDISPLKIKLNKLAKLISKIGYIAAFLISISYLFSKIFILNSFNIELIRRTITLKVFVSYLLESLTLAVSVLVMSVPEGLPMMITLVLSTNSKKMLKDNVLVRKMVGIETAGSLNILFTDKTGTITKGKMEVVSVMDCDINEYYLLDEMPIFYQSYIKDVLLYNNETELDKDTNTLVGGNITDKALRLFINMDKDNTVKVLDKLIFNSTNKYSTTIIEKNNKKIKLIKGSPDKILKYANYYIDKNSKKKILNNDRLLNEINIRTSKGLRAIAVSFSESIYPVESIRRNTLIGIVFIKDDIRPEAKDSISLIKKAGINVVMVTGDSLNTATSIAKEVGIIDSDKDIALTSLELKKCSDDELKEILKNIKVVARAMPEDKKRLVTLAKDLNMVTGMTGDGVNDSIALKKADTSFAMGSGTEVAKEASDIVILDDNILSISKAILYGRTTFKNIRKFIIFQLSINFSAVSLSLIGPFIGIPSPIGVIQMLWINMVMDTLAGLAFSYEVPRREYMEETPKKKDENIINKYMLNEIIVSGLYTLIISLIFLKLPLIDSLFINYEHKMTAFFTLFIFLAVSNAFNARTERINIFANLFKNKAFVLIVFFIILVQFGIIYFGFNIFNTTRINISELLIVIMISLTIIPLDLIRKYFLKKYSLREN